MAVGFGIKDAASASNVAAIADGVVVGSALINTIAQGIANGYTEAAAIDKAVALLTDIRAGVNKVASAP